MAQLIGTIFSMILSIVLPLVIQRAWVKRLSPERRARMWNVASWASALYGFGPFSMLGFVWLTRASAPHREILRAFVLVASLFGLGMLLVVAFSGTSREGEPSPFALGAAVFTCAFPSLFAAATAKKGDRARDAIAMGVGLAASVVVTGIVAGLTQLVVLAYEASIGA